jgi:xylulose-5-phosphate/fructose-6-phosphate phosphoketolase
MTTVDALRTPGESVTDGELELVDAYWRAANYLSVGQIYLLDNPLLAEPLHAEHIKPRLLGHWGTTPGLNFVLAHLNRVIIGRDLDMIYVLGPGHGGPAAVATAWLDRAYSDLYPSVSRPRTDRVAAHGRQPGHDAPGAAPSRPRPTATGTRHQHDRDGAARAHTRHRPDRTRQ